MSIYSYFSYFSYFHHYCSILFFVLLFRIRIIFVLIVFHFAVSRGVKNEVYS